MNVYKLQNHRVNLVSTRMFRVCDLTSSLVVGIKAISRRNAMLKGKEYFGDTSKVLVLN